MNATKKQMTGWGNYPWQENTVYYPTKVEELQELITSKQESSYLPRGLGRSYGDTALNESNGLLMNEKMNRILSFDPATGIVECEAGVSYEDLLHQFVPQGFFPPVTPGTKFVTMGGAIANDVHGKNHHKDGSIANFVIDFDLLTGTGEILHCSREENADVFWATIGGIGLTGMILKTRIRLKPIETSYFDVHYDKTKNLDEALEQFLLNDDKYTYSVAWIDCIASGDSLGRSVLMRGNHTPADKLSPSKQPLKLESKLKVNVPFYLPSSLLNPTTIKAFNAVYYGINSTGDKVVHYDPFFYPLDMVHNWNRGYGRKGFVQYQVAFPPGEVGRQGLVDLLTRLSEEKLSSFLAVLKTFGEGNEGLLSFPMKGYTLALDVPIKDGLFRVLRELDDLVMKYNGRIYLGKDSALTPEYVPVMYPELNKFQEIKKRIDPNNVFNSSMARRLNLLGDA